MFMLMASVKTYVLLVKTFFSSVLPRGVEPYDPPTTVLVQRSEPQGASTILSSTDFFQSEHNRRVILDQVDSFQLREKYMFATTTRVREPGEGWPFIEWALISSVTLINLTEAPIDCVGLL